MSNVKFLPWIGTNYKEGIKGKRILVLGESHYCANESEAVATLTQDIIKDLFDENSVHEGYKNTYTKFAKALVGEDLQFSEREAVWNSVAFYNYVQFPISEARKSPTAEEFLNSEAAFFNILNDLQPDYIIAWGKRLYNNLPDKGNQGVDLVVPNEEPIETWTYILENKATVQVLGITHPSAGFSWDWWYKMIDTFIER